MRSTIPLLILFLAVGCSRPPPQYVAPAPDDAVECALRQALELGYQRVEGGADEGMVRVAQAANLSRELGPEAEPTPATGERLEVEENALTYENQLIFRREDGRLHIQIVSLADDQPVAMPMPQADTHARLILAQCASP